MSSFTQQRPRAACVLVLLVFILTQPAPAAAQNRFARIAIKAAVCGGAAYGGYKLGDKIANSAIARMSVAGPEAERVRKALQIGTAAALCGTGVLLTGTIFNSLSERDRKAREKEMAAALEDANPGTRTYVLPDSKREGRLETEAAVQDGDKVCRQQVDFIAGPNEPAATRWCRDADNPKGKYELEFGV
jgi:surface antigen